MTEEDDLLFDHLNNLKRLIERNIKKQKEVITRAKTNYRSRVINRKKV